jgi:hypothetical protein
VTGGVQQLEVYSRYWLVVEPALYTRMGMVWLGGRLGAGKAVDGWGKLVKERVEGCKDVMMLSGTVAALLRAMLSLPNIK